MHYYSIAFALAACCLCALGCRANSAQLTTCQSEKEQLLTTIRTQRDSNRTLQTQVASLESRLDQAEKELVRASSPTRLSSVPSRTSEPQKATPPPPAVSAPSSTRSDGLPWRSPARN
jgi:septal ring factor EnvC (AmiA/AmiB activator)